MITQISRSFSVSPRLILALLEFQGSALTNPTQPENVDTYMLGYFKPLEENLYYQLILLVDDLNDAYYRWRDGSKLTIDLQDGKAERFDPWQNAATVALHTYFAEVLPADHYEQAVSQNGFARLYRNLFGDPWQSAEVLIPGSLNQPDLLLPFTPGKVWSYSGGPHPVWGVKQPWAAIDFAPPSDESGCVPSAEWVTAAADGVIVRTELGVAVLDLDGDGDERTGWNILYLHLSREDMVLQGKTVKAGDVIGHPSCERGDATGTHIHIGRKYNGEWINSYGVLPFNLEGWVVTSNGVPYQGNLTRHARVVSACECGDSASSIQSQR
ncbi:MAG: M23 family metallopeptidase [Anaerolineaceae bacterium]|nr:M23 family metallopeptidase [Anaerolineaceae bacterium]